MVALHCLIKDQIDWTSLLLRDPHFTFLSLHKSQATIRFRLDAMSWCAAGVVGEVMSEGRSPKWPKYAELIGILSQ